MEKRRVRLEVLAQVVSKNYDLNLEFGDSDSEISSKEKIFKGLYKDFS